MMNAPESVDAYLATLEPLQRETLEALRSSIRAEAPEAVDCISYGMPALRVDGRILCYYAAASRHCALYPGSGRVIDALGEELSAYSTSKGTIRFTPESPLPAHLVRKIVRMRLEQLRG